MIWIAGIASIVLILAILSIHPHELAVLSESVDSQQWQSISYQLLSVVLLLCIVVHSFKVISINKHIRLSQALSSNNPSSSQFLSPINVIFKQGVINILARSVCLILFLFAVISHTLSQRINFLEASPIIPIYVQATVTPIGLSDRRLTLSHDQKYKESNKKREVVEGYRQLVKLTNIKPDTDLLGYEAYGKTEYQNKVATNPFSNDSHQNSPPLEPLFLQDNRSTLGIKEYTELPDTVTVMLRTYNTDYEWLNDFSPDKVLTMRLKLEPLEVTEDDTFDEYQWLSTRHATAIAQIIKIDSAQFQHNDQLTFAQKINKIRYQFRAHFLSLNTNEINGFSSQTQTFNINELKAEEKLDQNDSTTSQEDLKNNDNVAVTLSLLTGDRSLISTDMTGLYRFSGISHLLAISGAHVLFLAVLTATLAITFVNTFYPSLYRILPRWQLSFVIAVHVAFLYALFSGFDVPAVRTAVMLGVVGIVRYFLAAPSVYKVLLFIALAMAWQDIFVLWQSGFWLSFIAVIVLIIYSRRWGKTYPESADLKNIESHAELKCKSLKRLALNFLKLQVWMSISLLPVSLWLFGKVSLWGFVTNVFAIGLFGWLIVPLNLLAGLIYPIWSQVANEIWRFIFWILDNFHNVLFTLQNVADQTGWLYTDISLPILFLIVMVVLPWVLPKGVWGRLYSLPPLMILLYLPFLDKEDAQSLARVVPLETYSKSVSATLVTHNDYNWLLLSAYSKGYKNDEPINESELVESSQAVYDALKNHDIGQLTGVVVQTATPELAMSVASIRKAMPIDYYWQAGLEHSQSQIDGYLKKVPLTPQSCKKGQVWQISSNNKYESIGHFSEASLMAVSGWPEIDDSQVWDCTVMLTSQSKVGIVKNKTLNILAKTAPNQNGILENKASQAVTKDDKPITRLIFYTSSNKRHAKLWQLMCGSSVKGVLSSVVNKHWAVNDNAYPSTGLVDSMQPSSWHIMTKMKQPKSAKMAEVELYWQQSYLDRDQ